MNELNDAYEAYDKDYQRRKNEIRTKLECIYANSSCNCHKLNEVEGKWLKQAIKFIQEEHR